MSEMPLYDELKSQKLDFEERELAEWLLGEMGHNPDEAAHAFAAACSCIADLEAKLAEAERDIANAVRQGKERVPDYPWSKGRESLASEAVWACAMVIEGLTKHCENVEKRLAEAEAVVAKLPRTQDHKPLVPGMTVWFNDKDSDEPLPATVKDFFDWGGGEDDCWDDDEYDVAVVWAAFDSQRWHSMDATRAYSTPEAAKEARDADHK